MAAVNDGEAVPWRTKLLLFFSNGSDQVGGLKLSLLPDHSFDRRTAEVPLLFLGVELACGVKRRTLVRQRHTRAAGEDWRIFVDDCKSAPQNRIQRSLIRLQRQQARSSELSLEKAESCTGGPTETINCLVGIAYGKQVAVVPSQQAQDLNLGEVCVLELVDQDKASALPFVRKQWRILAK